MAQQSASRRTGNEEQRTDTRPKLKKAGPRTAEQLQVSFGLGVPIRATLLNAKLDRQVTYSYWFEAEKHHANMAVFSTDRPDKRQHSDGDTWSLEPVYVVRIQLELGN